MSTFKTARTKDEVLKAIKASGGVKATIAKRLNVTRQTVDNYLNRWSTVRQAYIDEKAGIDDLALSVVIEDITKKNVETAKWWISKKLDEFKPVQKVEHDLSAELLDLFRTLPPTDRKALATLFPDMSLPREGIEA